MEGRRDIELRIVTEAYRLRGLAPDGFILGNLPSGATTRQWNEYTELVDIVREMSGRRGVPIQNENDALSGGTRWLGGTCGESQKS
jgi:hypothetical protein